MNNNTQIETVEEAIEKEYPLADVPDASNIDWTQRLAKREGFFKGANWKKQQDEAEIQRLNASYEDSLSMQKCSNAGYESKINEWEAKYKELLDSHNELLEGIKEISEVSNGIGVLNQNWLKGFCEELINKAKNIKL
jgi:hypothetical protein